MESPAHRRLTASEGRKFAFTLAFGFGAIAALVWWRGSAPVSGFFAGVAAVAFVAGLAAPTQLGPIARAWAAFGAALSRITSPVFFTLIYMVVVAPIGLIRRTFGRSPLARDRGARSYWVRRPVGNTDLERQF